MKSYEYKIHYLKLETGTPNEQQLLDALNQAGREGWRLNRLYGEVSLRTLVSWKGGLNFLAAGEDYDQARRDLEKVSSEATRLDLLSLAYEARLTAGEVRIAAGAGTVEEASGRAELQALAVEAKRKGGELIARKASAAVPQPEDVS